MGPLFLSMLQRQAHVAEQSGTFTVPDGVYCLFVTLVAGGGGGNASSSGGAGGWVDNYPVAVQPGWVLQINIGAAGSNGTGAVGGAGNGGNSSLVRLGGSAPITLLEVYGGGGAYVHTTTSGISANSVSAGDGGYPNGSGGGCTIASNLRAVGGGIGTRPDAPNRYGKGEYTAGQGFHGRSAGEYGASSNHHGGKTPFHRGAGGRGANSTTGQAEPGLCILRWVGSTGPSNSLGRQQVLSPTPRVLDVTTTRTFTVPAGVTVLWVWGCAGGGGRGRGGCGGGAGGLVQCLPIQVTPGSTLQLNIGAGGQLSAAVGVEGTPGGNTTILSGSNVLLTLWGGGGGISNYGGNGGFPGGSGAGAASPDGLQSALYAGGTGVRRSTNSNEKYGGGHAATHTALIRIFGQGPLAGANYAGGRSPFPLYGRGGGEPYGVATSHGNGEPGMLKLVYFSDTPTVEAL